MRVRDSRQKLRVSQSRLAALSGVSRFKICLYERGDVPLTPDELERLRVALQVEADRQRAELAEFAILA